MNLTSLGIPVQLQQARPTDDTYPLMFNPACERHWGLAVRLAQSSNPKKAWEEAILEFTKLCENAHQSPFNTQESKNDMILTRLVEARKYILKFLEKYRIINELKPYRVNRRVNLTSTGFQIIVDVQAKKVDADPSFLYVMGVRKGLSRDYAAYWSRQIRPNVEFFVANEGAKLNQRWHYGYKINIDIFPTVPGKPMATSEDIEKFILDSMYVPIIRSNRPLNYMQHLI